MKKLLLFLLLIPNLVMAEIWTFSDASGFWSSPTSERKERLSFRNKEYPLIRGRMWKEFTR